MPARRLAAPAAIVLGVASVLWILSRAGLFEPGRLSRGVRNVRIFVADLVPPEADGSLLSTLLRSLAETLEMAWAGTLLGAVLAVPLGVLAARTLFPRPLTQVARLLLAGVRTIPSLLWAVFFVVIVGLGPLAGILGLAAYTVGYLGKLYYEALEAVDPDVIDAARTTGATRLQIARHTLLPEAANSLLSQGMFAFEYNVRASSILGLVGAGGIGFYLLRFIERFEYRKLATALLLIFALVVLVDAVSRRVRARFLGGALGA